LKTIVENVEAVRKLGATGALIALVLYFAYLLGSSHGLLPVMSKALADHSMNEKESLHIARKNCFSLAILAKQDPSDCAEKP